MGRGLGGRERGRGVGELTFSSVAEKTGRCREIILTVRNKVAVDVWIERWQLMEARL